MSDVNLLRPPPPPLLLHTPAVWDPAEGTCSAVAIPRHCQPQSPTLATSVPPLLPVSRAVSRLFGSSRLSARSRRNRHLPVPLLVWDTCSAVCRRRASFCCSHRGGRSPARGGFPFHSRPAGVGSSEFMNNLYQQEI